MYLDYIDELVDGGVDAAEYVCAHDAVLAADHLHDGRGEYGLGDHGLEVNRTLVLPPVTNTYLATKQSPSILYVCLNLLEHDIGRGLVESDSESVELSLDDVLVREGLERVEHDEDDVAGGGGGDDLAPTTLPVLGALDDTGEIQNLDLRTSVQVIPSCPILLDCRLYRYIM